MPTTPQSPPSQESLATALRVSRRRVRQLIADGMPSHNLEAALAWRKAETTSDSADELRRARIALVKSQREKIEIENARLRGELAAVSEVCQSIFVAVSVTRQEFLRLPHELPGKLAGLDEAQICRVLRNQIHSVLERLSDSTAEMFEKHEPASPTT